VKERSALGRFFDWIRFGWFNPQIECRQCKQRGFVRTMKGAVKKGFCCSCRTLSHY
jgi:hypothetical protein